MRFSRFMEGTYASFSVKINPITNNAIPLPPFPFPKSQLDKRYEVDQRVGSAEVMEFTSLNEIGGVLKGYLT